MTDLAALLACPRCDKSPLQSVDLQLHCSACDVMFPQIDGMPWMFSEPLAALGEWRGRMHFALEKIAHEIVGLDNELQSKDIDSLAKRRVERYRKALDAHRQSLQKLLQPLELQTLSGQLESYLALRTRLPNDHGLNTYYANVHRDWAWGDEENRAALQQIEAVMQERTELGRVLVLGSGAGRLAYDIHTQLNCATTVAVDFNPMLMLVANAVTRGDTLSLHEFPIAPFGPEDDVVRRELGAPKPIDERFHLVFADALRAPFPEQSFDTVVTPWLIDVINEDLPLLAARINRLLSDNGCWLNFGSLAFSHPQRARCYSAEETQAIIAENGFADSYVSEATIPYMCSPASRHGRQERVFSFSASKERDVKKPKRYTALPEWLVTGKDPVPLSASFKQQAMTTQIYAFIMSLIDGKRSIKDMAIILETQKLMTKEEAEPAIRSFITKMHDDANKQSGF